MSDQQRDTWRRAILGEFADVGNYGLTCDEVEDRLNLPHQTCSARITELLQQSRLYVKLHDGIQVRRKTRSGRNARVYIRGMGD